MIDLGINLFQEIAALGGGGGYPITNSLRFNDNDSAYLSRTPSVEGNRKTWTWSGWVKRSNLPSLACLFAGSNNAGTSDSFFFDGDRITYFQAGIGQMRKSSALFRDSSGWYHIIGVSDSSNATAQNRFRIYVNGVEITSWSTNLTITQNRDGFINFTSVHTLGANVGPSQYSDGYMAEVNFIDGQALTADDFGQIDATTGEWSPKAYAGTYGTNGFYLPFDGNADDDSGNGNNWTENNLAPTDYMIDTPTNNFATLNPLADNFATYSQGNLSLVCGTTGQGWTFSTMALPSTGKWYVEAVWTGTPSDFMGFNSPSLTRVIATRGQSGQIWADDVLVETITAWSAGQIVGLQVDCDAGTFQFYRDGVAFGSSHSFTHIDGMSFGARDGSTAGNTSFNMNYGADSSFAGNKTGQGNTDVNGKGDFYYQPAFGYLALCTDNLPAPAIEQPETQFNVVTYTGTGATQNITDVGFQSDLVWLKSRSDSRNHRLMDSVRGINNVLASDLSIAEYSGSVLSSINSDGFTLNTSDNSNVLNETYVAWCWKAGGTAVSNTDGSITSQVSANVDAGFSIVSWVAGSEPYTVGHGLGVAPSMIITRSRTSVDSWQIGHSSIGWTKRLFFTTGAATTTSVAWNDTAPTSSVFTFGATSISTGDMIAYCFAEVEGFSKFGSYVGNGLADGPFVYTGFKPAFVMVKRTDSTSPWLMYDNKRDTFNQTDNLLRANTSQAETGSGELDFLSNGFKYRGASSNPDYATNQPGGTYIFMAFAEHPFKEALAR